MPYATTADGTHTPRPTAPKTSSASLSPTLIAHGDDQIVPLAASAPKSADLIKNATLKIYPGCPHGLADAFERGFNNDLLAFLNS